MSANLKTVVSVSGPHYSTPLANFFTTMYGKNLLYVVTLLIIVGPWRRPITLLGGFIACSEDYTFVACAPTGDVRSVLPPARHV